MNLDFLTEVLITRRQEIADGKNLATAQPIYVVLSLVEQVASGHTEYSITTNYKGKDCEFGYIDLALEPELRYFSEVDNGMRKPEAITRFWTDRIVAFFLTSEAAHAYTKYQSHNMRDPYVYVFHSGYGNRQMDKLLEGN